MNKVTVKERADDWIAYLNDDRTIWEAGKTKYEAFWKLFVSVGLDIGIRMEEIRG